MVAAARGSCVDCRRRARLDAKAVAQWALPRRLLLPASSVEAEGPRLASLRGWNTAEHAIGPCRGAARGRPSDAAWGDHGSAAALRQAQLQPAPRPRAAPPPAVLVAWRSRRSTIMRFLAPMFFLLLALVMQVALDASLAAEGRYRPITTGVRQDISNIPDCNSDLYIHDRPCVTLIYTPSSNLVAQVRAGGRGALVGGLRNIGPRLACRGR